jgi:DNA replication and repair protein RecF
VSDLNAIAGPLFVAISGGETPLAIAYQPSLELGELRDSGGLAARLAQGLRELRRDELARGQTLIGPHRDDLAFTVGPVNLGRYGSRGQQRSVTLALKLGEAELMRARSGDSPVLLLDDLLSELDAVRRAHMLEVIRRPGQQTLLSATDLADFGATFLGETTKLRVEEGRIYPS